MQTNTTTRTDATAVPGDPRQSYARASAIAATVIEQVTVDHLRAPTPCSEFDVEDLTRHLIAIGRRVLVIAQGQPAEVVPLDVLDVEPASFARSWVETDVAVAQQWRDDRILAEPMVLPFGTLPGALALAVYTAEVMVHTWDLATAIGFEPTWDQPLAAEALETVQAGVPAEGRGPEMPFDPVTPTPDDAPAMDRLVAWLGRKP